VKTIKKWRRVNGIADARRSGRPSVLCDCIKDIIEAEVKDKWGASVKSTTKTINSLPSVANAISRRTIQRYVQSTEWGKIAYRSRTTFMLSARNVEDRKTFCDYVKLSGYCDISAYGIRMRENILFTDESTILLNPIPNSENTRIRTSDPALRTAMPIPSHSVKIMVAGGITASGLTSLHIVHPNASVTGEYYRRHILPVYFAALSDSRSGACQSIFSDPSIATFMQDGAPSHSAGLSLQSIAAVFPHIWARGRWPGGSPDLNPIEHIWAILQDSVFRHPKPTNRRELIARVTETWHGISQFMLSNLIHSFPSRIAECVERNGRQTDY
jgi:hypothetical protein